MWLLTGPFDSSGADVSTTKTKLLKTSTKVPLGRKDRPLLVNNKKISRDHCEFTVGPCTPDDVPNPSFVPMLQIRNTKDKAMFIERDGQAIIVNPSSECELKSGDKIIIVVGISIEVQWRRVACFLPPARSLPFISTEDCAALGISLVTSPNALATHHLTPKYELTAPLATSLLSATQLVKAEWLQEFIHLGTTPDDGHPFKLTPLEQTFVPPPESKYRPVFSPSLPLALKSFKFWEPNEGRLHLLKGYRFVLLGEREDRVDGETRELVVRGGGEYECFLLTSGEAKWKQLLGKAKRKMDEAGLKVVIVSREKAVRAAVGADKWQEMVAEVQSLSLPLVSLETLLNVVINTDTSLINDGASQAVDAAESSSPLPDFVPNTHPDEPSPATAEEVLPESNDIRPKSPSPPSTLFGLAIPPPPSKKLIRRSKPVSTTGRTEEPVVPDVKNDSQTENLGYTLPPLPEIKRSTRLKRRTPAPAPSVEEPAVVNDGDKEPPLKKFKALFDASDPDKMIVDTPSPRDVYDTAVGDSVSVTQGGESVTQSDLRLLHTQVVAPRTLDAVAEEEEESLHSQSGSARCKSPLPQVAQEPKVAARNSGANRKGASRTTPQPTQSHQMDTDPAFLTAIASRKRKKNAAEDDFDREFNHLRISEADIRGGEEPAWEALGDFDIESRNMRGNFMVILEMDVLRPNSARGSTTAARRTYDGRPNFKKFRKIPTPSSRAPIELVARSEQDYGMGTGYWKDNAAFNDQASLPPTQTTQGTQKRHAPTVLESDGAESDVPAPKPIKKGGRGPPRSKPSAAAEKLFLNSDEEDDEPNMDQPETRGKSRSGTSGPARSMPTRGSKRRHIIADDDSDDGVAFKGFGKKRRV